MARRLIAALHQRRLTVPLVTRRFAPKTIDDAVPSRRDEPSGRARRKTIGRPSLNGHGKGVLDRFFGEIDVAESTDENGNGPAVLVTKDPLDLVQCVPSSWNGRTSIASGESTVASLRPHSSAPSRSAAVMMVNPPRCSLPSV